MLFPGFTSSALSFLRQLKKNNRREWFQARKATYDDDVLRPMRLLVEEMDVRLAAFAPEVTGSPKRSIFRIYRDVRFSKDKSPYKTHIGAWFTHQHAGHGVGSETHGAGAGFYIHIEPGGAFVAGGVWMPPRPALNAIREGIARAPKELAGILASRQLKARFRGLDEEHMLTRVPRPWTAEHPAARLLRFCSFTISGPLTDAEVVSKQLPKQLDKDFRRLLPFVRWLNSALGHAPLDRRT